MSHSPEELRYAKTHEWVRAEEDGSMTVGITDHAQEALGDVVYVELPSLGDTLAAADQAGVVESVKAASDIYAPVSGTVIELNDALADTPELINSEPYNEGWFYRLQPSDPEELQGLLSAEEYNASCEED